MNSDNTLEKALALWRQHGGTLRTREALALGIHPRTLYALRDAGLLESLGRGLYRLADLPPLANPDLVTVALKVPRGVICLISALAFHELTTQVPHVVSIALERGDRRPRLDYPPLQVFWFSGAAWSEGIETHAIDQTPVRFYSPAKSVADSFKFRQQIGLDVALEALRIYRQSPQFDPQELLHFARICRVESVIRPYLEALA
jgi:predicted transcriptional regulator of viral defense system